MKQALIVIDVLVDFVTGALANPNAQAIVGNIAALAERVRADGGIVVFANDAHLPGDFEEKVWGAHALAGTPGAQVVEGLVADGDYQVPKRVYSSFYETGLDSLLRQNGVEGVILAGQHTHICVRHTAADAFFRGYPITVAADTVAVFDQGSVEATEALQADALAYLKMAYAANVVDTWKQV